MPPASPGMGRVVIDVVDGPTPVRRVTMTATPLDGGAPAEGTSTVSPADPNAPPPPIVHRPRYRFSQSDIALCESTPCVAQLPLGNVLVGFPVIGQPDKMESELIHVSEAPTVYRRQLSLYEDHTGAMRIVGLVGAPVGAVGLSVGGVLLSVGLDKHKDGMTTAGAITLGASTALLVASILMIRADAPTFRPGSANHYPLDTPAPVQPPGVAP